MDTKLTIKLDQSVIQKAKAYAKAHNTSLSKVIENYLNVVVSEEPVDIEITPLVQSLSGVISPPPHDYKKDYADYLREKYR